MNRKTVLIALAISITAAWVASAVLKKRDKGPMVLVAANAIPERQVLSEELFVKQSIPADLHNKSMVAKLDPKRRVYASAPLAKGEILYQNRLGFVDEEPELSYMIDRNQGVITIAVTAVSAVSGIIKPGDQVDVLVTYDIEYDVEGKKVKRPSTKRIVTGCKVVAVGNEVIPSVRNAAANFNRNRVGGDVKRVSLAASDTDIEKIVYAQTNGKVHLALKTETQKSPESYTAYDMDDMRADLFGVVECIRAQKSDLIRVDR